jgi:hypothetical protein
MNKNSIVDKNVNNKFIERINNLTPDAKPLWGKMYVLQMLVHTANAIKLSIGETKAKRVFMGYLVGGLAKKMVLKDEKPIKKGAPTSMEYVVPEGLNLEEGKSKLINYVKIFPEKGESVFTNNQHPFFGSLTPSEWDRLMYKHLDHHLRQFGV